MKPGSRCPTRNWRPYGLREIRSMANGITPSVPDHDGSSNCCPVPKRGERRDCSSVTGLLWHGSRNQAWDRAIRRIRGQLGVVEGVPSRFPLFLPSDPQIGPGNAATVSENRGKMRLEIRGKYGNELKKLIWFTF